MNKYISEFLDTRYAGQLSDYFDALERKKEDSLFLMPRRALQFYFLVAGELNKGRFLNRCHCFEEYIAAPQELERYQTIYLAGDAMSSGYQLFHYYCVLKKISRNHRIVSIVYALSTEFLRNSLLERMYEIYYEVNNVPLADQNGVHRDAAANMWRDFVAHLYCHRYLNQENMSLFGLSEIRLIQGSTCAVMSASTAVKYKRPTAPIRSWLESLCQDTTDWRYVPLDLTNLSYEVFGGGLQMGYFECCHPTVKQNSFLVNSVILCKYWEDDTSDVIFAPVSIGRSCKKARLLEIFRETATNIFPTQTTKRPAGYDLHLMYHWLVNIYSLQVCSRFQDLLHTKGLPAADYTDGSLNLPIGSTICLQAAGMAVQEEAPGFPREVSELSDAFHMVKNEILCRESRGNVAISVEDIEGVLTDYTQNPNETKSLLTGVLILLMETAVCSNTVFEEDGMIKNALIPEENSNCLLSPGEQLCHICADVLYISRGADVYESQKSSFLAQMKQELKRTGTFADNLTEKHFFDYSAMLKCASREDAPYKILGKRFLVRNLSGLLKDVQVQAIQKLEER